MEFDKNTPIYFQIMFEIKRRISTGQLQPGDPQDFCHHPPDHHTPPVHLRRD